MLDSIFRGIFDTEAASVIAVSDFLSCIAVSLLIGIIITLAYTIHTRYTRSFAATLATLPAVVCVIIMMVNGNIGTSVAVAGAFSLVRFRSLPGTAKEIGALFLAMAAGIIAGMGYLAFAFLFAVILAGVMLVYNSLDLVIENKTGRYKTLNITIPENLDYTGVFDDLFSEYTSASELTAVKTTNMGSLYRLTYKVTLKDIKSEKELIDALRCRNGNLEISVSNQEILQTEL